MNSRIFYLVAVFCISSQSLLSQSDTLKQIVVDSSSAIPRIGIAAPESRSLRTKLFGQFLLGSGFSEDRGAGIGVRATYLLRSNAFVGVTFVIHLGPVNNALKTGYGTMYYFGGELGGRILLPSLSIEPLISMGQAVIQIPDYEHATAMESKLYLAPGMSMKTLFDDANVGIHFRYIMIDPMAFFAIYLSYGV